MQANFVGEQADAWLAARSSDSITILAPHHPGALREESRGRLRIRRFRYFRPEGWQKLAYPAILPNIKANPMLLAQVPAYLVAEYLAASQEVRAGGYDLIYAHWVMPQGLVAWRLHRAFGIPYVLQHHSSDLAVFRKLGGPGETLARNVLRDAAHFFCVNADQRELALSFFDGSERDRFAERCTVLPMGMVPPATKAASGDAKYDVATIGRLSRKKGINFLIGAAEALAAEGIRPTVGIAGDGEDRAQLECLVVNADVTFAGFLDGPRKDRFFDQSSRFAFPAKASGGDVEGLPVTLLEVLCRGLPALASRDTNIELLPEWPALKECVVFIDDPEDPAKMAAALKELLGIDPVKARRAAQIAGRYRWDRLIEEYLGPIEATLR